jgi:hypothetical protein
MTPKYLVQRKQSKNWYVDLTFPDGFTFPAGEGRMFGQQTHFIKSLRTADVDEAAINAAPYIQEFRILVYDWKRRGKEPVTNKLALAVAEKAMADAMAKFEVGSPEFISAVDASNEEFFQTFIPQRSTFARPRNRLHKDGHRIIDGRQARVWGDKITFYGESGDEAETVENGIDWSIDDSSIDDPEIAKLILKREPTAKVARHLTPEPANPDDDLIERYIRNKHIKPRIADDTRSTWADYKRLVC